MPESEDLMQGEQFAKLKTMLAHLESSAKSVREFITDLEASTIASKEKNHGTVLVE